MPLSAGLSTLAGQYTKDWALMMAASVMAMAPIFAVFFAMQRKVIEGLATSGLKDRRCPPAEDRISAV